MIIGPRLYDSCPEYRHWLDEMDRAGDDAARASLCWQHAVRAARKVREELNRPAEAAMQ